MRGVTRQAPGAILALGAPLGVAALDGTVDLAVGVGGIGGEPLLAQVVRGLSRGGLTSFEDVIAQPRARRTMTPEGHALRSSRSASTARSASSAASTSTNAAAAAP